MYVLDRYKRSIYLMSDDNLFRQSPVSIFYKSSGRVFLELIKIFVCLVICMLFYSLLKLRLAFSKKIFQKYLQNVRRFWTQILPDLDPNFSKIIRGRHYQVKS